MRTEIYFGHGLGDCIYFAHQLPLYCKRGIEIALACPPDKRIVFEPCGVKLIEPREGLAGVPWYDSHGVPPESADEFWVYNKAALNLSRFPLPDIGTSRELWDEVCAQTLDYEPFISMEVREKVDRYVESLPRPLVLVHSMGNSLASWKSLPPDLTLSLYHELLDRIDGSLLLLDWDDRVSRLANWRVRHLTDDWERLDVAGLLYLLRRADLLLAIDSGPLHAARTTSTPTVGLFPHPDHYPTRWCLPRARQVNMVVGGTRYLNRKTRDAFNIIESPQPSLDPVHIARVCARMLDQPRYLDSGKEGKDGLLQQFVLEWERGVGNGLSDYVDRDRGFDLLLREASKRFVQPLIVETGCIRAAEDWGGAGYSTYLLGAYVEERGGRLVSVDHDPHNCDFARDVMRAFARTQIICEDSLEFLARFDQPIDVLYLDSIETGDPQAAEHILREAQTASNLLHKQSLIVIDDSPYFQRQFLGLGAQAIPWLLENGWSILFSGYQTILQRL